jgi:sporulation protein YlmC with PRC-barrel domain
MIRASDLVGCALQTESGERLGHVHDLRAQAVDGGWTLVGLVIGQGGMAARLIGSGPDPLTRGDVIPWHTITELKDGLVIVHDQTTHGESDP